jgi:Na+/melibiose symporter-like transporter
MFALTWALILGPGRGWTSPDVLTRGSAGIALFALFARVEARRAHPMLDLVLFRSLPFVGAIAAMFAYAAVAQVMASLLPLFLQNARGDTPLEAGVGMLPFAIAMLVLPMVGRRLGKSMPPYRILTLGLLIAGGGNALLSFAAGSTNEAILLAGMVLLGSGGGLLNGETQKAIMSTVPRERAGMASGIATTSRFSGILLGFSGLGAVLAQSAQSALQHSVQAAGLTVAPGFIERVVAGDFERATLLYPPALGRTVMQVARAGYGAGFASAFAAATGVALVAAAIVFGSMYRRKR